MRRILVLAAMLCGCSFKPPTLDTPTQPLRGLPAAYQSRCLDLVGQELPDVVDGLTLTQEQYRCARAIAIRNCGNMYQELARRAEAAGHPLSRPDPWCTEDWVADSGEMMRRECGAALSDPLPTEVAGEVFRNILGRITAFSGPLQ